VTPAFVSGGSNLGAERNLVLAARELKQGFPGARFSRVYRNVAVGFEGPEFLNFVTELPVHGDVAALKAQLERIEALCGRPRNAPKWAPRAMDLDILLFGERVIDEPGLVVPRPQLLQWAFMLGPLAELAPQARHPVAGRSIGELWNAFDQAAHPMQATALDLNAA
jgi:2-amino-4-hydroxy-6-hydroxymethyldihydropteridine diphosphokinase